MKCPKCGKEIANDSMFCEYCGIKIAHKEIKFEARRLKRLWPWSLVLAIPLAVVLTMYFYIDNPKCHSFTIKGRSDFIEIRHDYTYFFLSPPMSAYKTPYHLNYKWVGFAIGDDWQTHSVIDGFFTPLEYEQNGVADWAFAIPSSLLPKFKPGEKYNIRIYGVHNGILFNREAQDICFTIKIPSNAGPELSGPIWLTKD